MPSNPSTVFSKGILVTSAFLNTELGRRSGTPASYLVWYDGTNYHADSMIATSDATPGTDAGVVLQFAINNSTS